MKADIEIIEVCEDCPAAVYPRCPERWIRASELARLTGVTPHLVRKWRDEGIVPHHRWPGEHTLYPEHRATKAIKEKLEGAVVVPTPLSDQPPHHESG